MKAVCSLGRLLGVILILGVLLVGLFPAQTSANPGWLTGWTYRQEITIGGSTAGVQTNLPDRLVVNYGEAGTGMGDPTGLTWLQTWTMPDAWDPNGHSQGAETDGTYVWWSSGDLIAKTLVSNPDWNNPLAINTHPVEDGSGLGEQINGIHLQGDYIYVTSPKFVETPYRCWVKWFNRDTLVFVGEQEIFWTGGGDCQEGIVYYAGYWWTIFFSRAAIAKYDTSFNFLECITLPGQGLQIQGHDWYGGQLWVAVTGGPMRVYDWNGSVFTLATTLTLPSQVLYSQSFGIVPNGSYLYYAGFSTSPALETLYKCTISWEGGGGGGATTYLNNHGQADFDDVRFTKSDGSTELKYWIQEKVNSDNAIIWVKLDYIPASPSTATFYMYYGNSGASTTSSGEDVFTWFDNAETGTPASQGWLEQGGGGYITYTTDDKYQGSKGTKITNTGGNYVYFDLSSGQPTDFHFGMRVKRPDATGDNQLGIKDTAPANVATLEWQETTYNLMWHNNTAYQDTGDNYSTSWELHELVGTASTDVIIWYQDGVGIQADAHRVAWANFDFFGWFTAGSYFYLDDIFLAKRCTPMPTWEGWGSEETEEGPSGGPVVSTNNPTVVTNTTGTLQGAVISIGDTSIAYRGFVWDTTSHADPGNVAIGSTAYFNNWSESGNYGVGAFTHPLDTLTIGELYYYRAGVRNNDDPVEWAYGPENGLITCPNPPTLLNATPNGATQVDLTWTTGTGFDKTKIVRKVGGYPTGITDGTEAYFGTLALCSDYGLTPGTTYYYRAWSYAEEGGYYRYSTTYSQDTATTVAGFAVTTGDAASITSSSAILGSTLTDDGGAGCSMQFLYGTSSPPTTPTGWVGGTYTTGYVYSKPLTGLLPNTQYYFQAQAKHADETKVSGSIKSFFTLGGAPGTPTNFSAVSTATQISLSWMKGTGAGNTLVRFSTDTYPATTVDGGWLYFGNGTSVSHTSGLVSGVTYYYSAWSEASGVYSTGKATASGALTGLGELPQPEGFGIDDVRVYKNYLQSGDVLFVLSYKALYAETPAADIKEYMKILVLDGDRLICQAAPPAWGFSPASIYQASDSGVVWGAEYTIEFMGRADKWTIVPDSTFTLSSSSWISSDVDTALPKWIIDTAKRIGDYIGTDLTQYVPGKGAQLNEAGAVLFGNAIPGLKDKYPDLFSSSAFVPTAEGERTKITYEPPPMEDTWGINFKNTLDELGSYANMSGESVGTVIWCGFMLIILGPLVLVAGPEIALVMALPMMYGGVELRMLPYDIVAIMGALLLLLALWKYFPRGT